MFVPLEINLSDMAPVTTSAMPDGNPAIHISSIYTLLGNN
jgi:hypothetical protein